MKYIDADSIKDEIKHLKIDVYDESHQFDLGARCSLTFLESFIDSLQQEQPEADLEEAAEKYGSDYPAYNDDQFIAENAFKAGAGWMAKQQPLLEDSVAFQKGVQEGKRLMMEGAVETDGEVCKLADRVWITPTDEKRFHQDVFDNFKAGDEVRIIILPNDEDNDRTIV